MKTIADVAIRLALFGAALFEPGSCSAKPLPQQESFTFVQLCDPQLGMGGYEHDVETFTKVVERINELKPDFVAICGDLGAGRRR